MADLESAQISEDIAKSWENALHIDKSASSTNEPIRKAMGCGTDFVPPSAEEKLTSIAVAPTDLAIVHGVVFAPPMVSGSAAQAGENHGHDAGHGSMTIDKKFGSDGSDSMFDFDALEIMGLSIPAIRLFVAQRPHQRSQHTGGRWGSRQRGGSRRRPRLQGSRRLQQ